MSKERLVAPVDIPASLWNTEEKHLNLPPGLCATWTWLLNEAGVMDLALENDIKGEIGGIDLESTNKHLATRFSGSSGRVQLAMLDPHDHLPEISNAFTRIFSANTVLLVDVPSGSGAASLSILFNLAELRRAGKIPREPLTVKLIGGEISPDARQYAEQAVNNGRPVLEEQAIFVQQEFVDWDVLDKYSNARFINLLTLRAQGCGARALILANFSGFLQKSGKWKEAASQFENLFLHSRGENSIVVWIEPKNNVVIEENGGFFSRIKGWLSAQLSELFSSNTDGELKKPTSVSEAKVKHPLKEGSFRVNLAVHRFDLPTNE